MIPVLETVVPVFAIVALGYALGGARRIDLPSLADLALLVTSPALIFSVLSGARVGAERWQALVGGTLWVAAGTGILAVLYLWASGSRRRGLLRPSVFWNSGNMGLACARLAFGPEGLEAAAIVFVTVAVLTSSAGIWISKGENGENRSTALNRRTRPRPIAWRPMTTSPHSGFSTIKARSN